ncbi:hypothetical protein EV646_114116 [Kribbella antiqua]|uniref:Phosphotransferase family enzyme n=2 Tax=Kribbella antiqua TaxID=2512217 RepID=A0A4R2ICK1_9ACTN|nr:hypothetical protein EV646_114116 [Kribbella antiqua]
MRTVMADLGSKQDAFGLIHADLHLDNALFDGDAVRLILDDFIATRYVAFGLWFAGMAQVNPAFAADLPKVMAWIERSLDRLL